MASAAPAGQPPGDEGAALIGSPGAGALELEAAAGAWKQPEGGVPGPGRDLQQDIVASCEREVWIKIQDLQLRLQKENEELAAKEEELVVWDARLRQIEEDTHRKVQAAMQSIKDRVQRKAGPRQVSRAPMLEQIAEAEEEEVDEAAIHVVNLVSRCVVEQLGEVEALWTSLMLEVSRTGPPASRAGDPSPERLDGQDQVGDLEDAEAGQTDPEAEGRGGGGALPRSAGLVRVEGVGEVGLEGTEGGQSDPEAEDGLAAEASCTRPPASRAGTTTPERLDGQDKRGDLEDTEVGQTDPETEDQGDCEAIWTREVSPTQELHDKADKLVDFEDTEIGHKDPEIEDQEDNKVAYDGEQEPEPEQSGGEEAPEPERAPDPVPSAWPLLIQADPPPHTAARGTSRAFASPSDWLGGAGPAGDRPAAAGHARGVAGEGGNIRSPSVVSAPDNDDGYDSAAEKQRLAAVSPSIAPVLLAASPVRQSSASKVTRQLAAMGKDWEGATTPPALSGRTPPGRAAHGQAVLLSPAEWLGGAEASAGGPRGGAGGGRAGADGVRADLLESFCATARAGVDEEPPEPGPRRGQRGAGPPRRGGQEPDAAACGHAPADAGAHAAGGGLETSASHPCGVRSACLPARPRGLSAAACAPATPGGGAESPGQHGRSAAGAVPELPCGRSPRACRSPGAHGSAQGLEGQTSPLRGGRLSEAPPAPPGARPVTSVPCPVTPRRPPGGLAAAASSRGPAAPPLGVLRPAPAPAAPRPRGPPPFGAAAAPAGALRPAAVWLPGAPPTARCAWAGPLLARPVPSPRHAGSPGRPNLRESASGSWAPGAGSHAAGRETLHAAPEVFHVVPDLPVPAAQCAGQHGVPEPGLEHRPHLRPIRAWLHVPGVAPQVPERPFGCGPLEPSPPRHAVRAVGLPAHGQALPARFARA